MEEHLFFPRRLFTFLLAFFLFFLALFCLVKNIFGTTLFFFFDGRDDLMILEWMMGNLSDSASVSFAEGKCWFSNSGYEMRFGACIGGG